MPDDIARLKIRIESLEAKVAEERLARLEEQGDRTERGIQSLGKSSFQVRNVLKGLGLAGAAAGSALAGGAILATREWLKYDKAIKEVQSITGQTAAEFQSMRKEVLGLAQDLGVDATQAARGLYQALSAGVPQGQQAIDFLRTASKTAIAGVTDVDTAVDGLTNVLNAFKIPVEEAETVADKLFQTVKDGKTNFEELASSIAVGAVPASALGVSLDELLASIVGITKQGESTSKAFTEVRAIMTALVKPTAEMEALFEQLGIESGRALIAQEGFAGALQKVRQGFNGNDAALAKALSSVEAYNGLLAITGDNLGEVERAQDNLANSTGAMAGAYKTNSQTLENALNSLKASAIGLVEQMEGSLGIIAAFTQALQGAALAIRDLSGDGLTNETERALAATGGQAVANLETRLNQLKAARGRVENFQSFQGGLDLNAPFDPEKAIRQLQDAQATFDENFQEDVTLRNKSVEQLNREIQAVEEALKKATPAAKALGAGIKEVEAVQADLARGAITEVEAQEKKAAILAKVKGDQSAIAQAAEEEAAAKAMAAAEEEARNKEAQEILAAQEAENKALQEGADLAERLAVTEAERLQTKIAAVEAAREAGRIEEETAAKALNSLREQLAAVQGAGGGASGGGGGAGAGGGIMGRGIDPRDIQLGPAISPEEDFEREIEELQFRFLEQRNLILTETQITEDERTRLLLKLTEERNNQLNRIEQERVTFQRELDAESLSIFENTLGQFNQVFANAGQEGSAIAKALFLAQKAAAIAGILVNTEAQAALAGAQTGIFGIPLQVLIRAQGAASAGIVAGTTIAGLFAHGGQIPAGQFGIVGETGPELVRGPAMVTSAAQTADMAGRGGGGSSAPVNINITNAAGPEVQIEARESEDRKSIDIMVRRAVNEVAQDINRGGGPVSRALEGTYQSVNRG